MRAALVETSLCVVALLLCGLSGGCKTAGKQLSGSTYCNPTAGSSDVPTSSLPSGSCKSATTCIAFTANESCVSIPGVGGNDCEWTCTCVDETWSCSDSCEACAADGGSLGASPDASPDDGADASTSV